MIAIKNLQYLHELMTQEEVLQAVARHYSDMLSDKNARQLMLDIIGTSEKNHQEMLKYVEGHQ